MNKQEAAIFYAQGNFPVFPLYGVKDGHCECSKGVACEHPGKHPRTAHGMKDATTDVTQITKWWSGNWKNSNIGIVTGVASRLVVVDVDVRHNGLESLELLESQHGKLPQTYTVKSGGGGFHYYFKHPQNAYIKSVSNFQGLSGMDVKADGGGIIAPPSKHISGGTYEIFCDEPVADLPEWLLTLLKPPQKEANKVNSGEGAGIAEGQRNERLTQIAGTLRRHGLSETALCAALKEINRTECQPPLPDAEVEAIAKSVSRYPAENDAAKNAATSIVKGGGNIILNPVSVSEWVKQLQTGEGITTSWIWEKFISTGGLTSLNGAPKGGKSTMARHLAVAVSTGTDFLGYKTAQKNVLWLALEERKLDVMEKLYALGAAENVYVLPPPCKATANYLCALKNCIREKNVGLVVVDTLLKFLGVDDENSAAMVDRAFEGILELARGENVAFLLIHHLRKAPAEGGEDIRGSSAIFGNVDVAIRIRKETKGDARRRVLRMDSRYDETPQDMVIELKDTEYHFVGTREDVKAQLQDVTTQKVTSVLKASYPAFKKAEEIAGEAELSPTSTRRICRKLVCHGMAESQGSGKKNDPEMFRLRLEDDGSHEQMMSPPHTNPIGGGINGGNNEGMADAVAMVMEIFEGAVIVSHQARAAP